MVRRHLTFANLASATALLVALAGSGVAIAAAELPKNSVGSKQIKSGAVKGADLDGDAVTGVKVAPDSLTGADVRESTLGQVPSAGTVATVRSVRRTSVYPAETPVATFGSLSVVLGCDQGDAEPDLFLSTSQDNASYLVVRPGQAPVQDTDFDVSDGKVLVAPVYSAGWVDVTVTPASGPPYKLVGKMYIDNSYACHADLLVLG